MPVPDALVRRASRAVAIYAAVVVAVVAAAVVVAVLVLDARQRSAEADRAVHNTWISADDVDDPPAGVYLLLHARDGRREATAGTPEAIRVLDPSRLPDGATRRTLDGNRLRIWTGTKTYGRVSAVVDLGPAGKERSRLLPVLGLAVLLSVLGAAGAGILIGRRATRPLGEAMALQRRFVADASHELRAPLTVLLTRAQLLRRRLPIGSPKVDLDALDQLVADAKVLGAVVTDMLVAAELEHRPAAGEDVDLKLLIADVVASLVILARDRGVELLAEPGDGSHVVHGSATAIRRAITSLTDNALAHTQAGGHVRLRTRLDDDAVVLAVEDEGSGIDPTQAQRLVQRFARDTDDDRGDRFGLGLALVDEVARAHGGRLVIERRAGRGSIFSLELPRSATGR